MDEQPSASESVSGRSAPQSRRDRRIKVGFAVLLIAAVLVVWLSSQRRLTIDDWGDDLTAALEQARAENRLVVAFFVDVRPSERARRIKKEVIAKPENRAALKEGRFIPVVVSVSSKDTPPARKYKFRTLPALIVLMPDGSERNRHDALEPIGEVAFRQEFLNDKPSEPTSR